MKVSVTNYKSVGKAEMGLGRVTVLLGPPAAGKSNLLEAVALATYFNRYMLYDDVEQLPMLTRAVNVRDLFTHYDVSKSVEINIDAGEWRQSLRIYVQKWPHIALNGTLVSIRESDDVDNYLFTYNGRQYHADLVAVEDLLYRGHMKKVLARLYGFDRFRDDVINSMINGVDVEAPQELLREDGKNFGVVAMRHPEVLKDVNTELAGLGLPEVKLLDDGRVAMFGGHVSTRPTASLLRSLYYLVGLSSTYDYARRNGLEGRALVLLEEPESHPRLLHLLVSYVAKFSEVGHVVITTHSPILVSLLRDRLDVTLYYVYRGDGGLTEVAELDKDKLAEELATSADILFMKPHEALPFTKR